MKLSSKCATAVCGAYPSSTTGGGSLAFWLSTTFSSICPSACPSPPRRSAANRASTWQFTRSKSGSTRQHGHRENLNAAARPRYPQIEIRRFHHEQIRLHGIHDGLGGVADEKPLEPRSRNDAHREDRAALAPHGARNGIDRTPRDEMR